MVGLGVGHRLRVAAADPDPRPPGRWTARRRGVRAGGRHRGTLGRARRARRCSSRCSASGWRACRRTRRSGSPRPSRSSRSWSAPSCWCRPSAACFTVGCCRGGCVAELAADDRQGPTRSERWANRVAARPLAWALAAVTVMLLLAAPVLDMRTWPQSGSDDPTASQARQTYDLLTDAFGPGAPTPYLVVADRSVLTDAEVATVVADLEARDDLVNVADAGGLAGRGSGGGERGVDVRRQRRPHPGAGGVAARPAARGRGAGRLQRAVRRLLQHPGRARSGW